MRNAYQLRVFFRTIKWTIFSGGRFSAEVRFGLCEQAARQSLVITRSPAAFQIF